MVGVTQETSAEKAIAALQEYSANESKVIRNGQIQRLKSDELVPGDIITVAIGDRVPADCRLLSVQSNSFRVDQSILTGESESVPKEATAIRKRLLESFSEYDAIAKRIQKLSCPGGPGSSQARLQAAILTRANLFLQKNMFPLQVCKCRF